MKLIVFLIGISLFTLIISGCTQTSNPINNPAIKLPPGKALTFHTISRENDVVYREENPQILIVTASNTFEEVNPWIKAEDVNKLNSIDYSKYFVVIAFNGFLGYLRADFQVKNVIQNDKLIYVISHFSRPHIPGEGEQPLNTSQSHLIKVEKDIMTQYGEITFKLLDESGQEKASATAIIN